MRHHCVLIFHKVSRSKLCILLSLPTSSLIVTTNTPKMSTPTPKIERWTEDEAAVLKELVEATKKLNIDSKVKEDNWITISSRIPGKSVSQCKSKWRRLKPKAEDASPKTKPEAASNSQNSSGETTPVKREATPSPQQDNGYLEKKKNLRKFFEARLDNILKLSDEDQLRLRDEFDLMLMKKLK